MLDSMLQQRSCEILDKVRKGPFHLTKSSDAEPEEEDSHAEA